MKMKRFFAIGGFLLCLSPLSAAAQSACPSIAYGAVLTAAQWQACFTAKADAIAGGYLPLSGGTMIGRITTAASTTVIAGLNLPAGTAPTSPIDGDLWTTTAGLYVQINGGTIGPLTEGAGGSFAATLPLIVTFPSSVVTYALNYNSTLTLDGSNNLEINVAHPNTWTSVQTFGTGDLAINGGTATAGLATVTSAGVVSSEANATVAQGGTNCTTASGTCLDNITGFSSTGLIDRTGAGTYSFTSPGTGVLTALGNAVNGTGGLIVQNAPSLTLGTQQTTQGTLVLANSVAHAYSTTIESSNSATAAYTLVLPPALNGSGPVILTDALGNGVLSWASPSAAASVTVGSTGCISCTNHYALYDNSGTLGNEAVVVTIHRQVFTSSGTYTPTTGMIFVDFQCVGGGGGGGGAQAASSQEYGGGGGGSGSYSEVLATASTVGSSQTVTIGAAGTGSANAGGTNGGATSAGSICVANGGSGGSAGNSSTSPTGGAGGTAGTGDIAVAGNAGSAGTYNSINANVNVPDNKGASGFWGGGAVAQGFGGSSCIAGNNAAGYGSGGGGATCDGTTSTAAGGSGSKGVVIANEYVAQ
jgi:hypothetical protein